MSHETVRGPRRTPSLAPGLDLSYSLGMDAGRSEADWLSALTLLAPLVVSGLGALALFAAVHAHGARDPILIGAVVLFVTVTLQAAVLLPLGLRGLKASTGLIFPRIRLVGWLLVAFSLVLLLTLLPTLLRVQ